MAEHTGVDRLLELIDQLPTHTPGGEWWDQMLEASYGRWVKLEDVRAMAARFRAEVAAPQPAEIMCCPCCKSDGLTGWENSKTEEVGIVCLHCGCEFDVKPDEPMNLRIFHGAESGRFFVRGLGASGSGDTPESAMRELVISRNVDASEQWPVAAVVALQEPRASAPPESGLLVAAKAVLQSAQAKGPNVCGHKTFLVPDIYIAELSGQVDELASASAPPEKEFEDFEADGVWYCGRCNKPTLPWKPGPRELHNLMESVRIENERIQAIGDELGIAKPEDRQGYTGPHTAFSIIAELKARASASTPPINNFTLQSLAAYLGWGDLTDEAVWKFAAGRERWLRLALDLLETHKSNAPTTGGAIRERVASLKGASASALSPEPQHENVGETDGQVTGIGRCANYSNDASADAATRAGISTAAEPSHLPDHHAGIRTTADRLAPDAHAAGAVRSDTAGSIWTDIAAALSPEPQQLLDAADAEVSALNNGKRWRMSIPVQSTDSDMVIANALNLLRESPVLSPSSSPSANREPPAKEGDDRCHHFFPLGQDPCQCGARSLKQFLAERPLVALREPSSPSALQPQEGKDRVLCTCGAEMKIAPGIGSWCTRTGVDAICTEQDIATLSTAQRLAALSETKEPQPDWQPIETAPKDGRMLLLGYSGTVVHGYWGLYDKWHGCDPDDFTFSNPTHWMPLPTPPVARASRVQVSETEGQ